ncbi:predicted protein [Nematostella vectensis]|uniref:Cytochrome P450 n=1 Tax=Nematostella vectensis TaxID=45351 RepID=A7SAR4_NEMVE|nr:predicted protein [Nematostella vectensis]|eukprot:XP_001631255.1 predicted protein [Nematostella vectensis]
MIIESALALFLILTIYHFFFEYKHNNLPPGPHAWPLIGNIPQIGKQLHRSLHSLSLIYGEVYRLYLGHTLVVVLTGRAIKEALALQPVEFGGRPWTVSFDLALRGERPLVFEDYGRHVKLHRKMGHRALKVYSQKKYQQVIIQEAEELCKRIADSSDRIFDVKKEFGLCIMNIICTKIFGSRYQVNNKEFLEILNIHDNLFRLTTVTGQSLVDIFPFLRNILPIYGHTKELQETHDEWQKILWRKYKQHLDSFDVSNIRDYTDALLLAKQEAGVENTTDQKYLENKYIVSAISTVFIAGSETTATSLCWAILYLIHFPKIQDQIYASVGKLNLQERQSFVEMRKMCPILEAFIAEVLRIITLLPLGVPHKTLCETILRGYTIPKGTTVLANLWSLHHNVSLWENPEDFNPERFLDKEGNFSHSMTDNLLPFGAGPRICMGENLARTELFLILALLLKQFRFECPPGQQMAPLECMAGISIDYCLSGRNTTQ